MKRTKLEEEAFEVLQEGVGKRPAHRISPKGDFKNLLDITNVKMGDDEGSFTLVFLEESVDITFEERFGDVVVSARGVSPITVKLNLRGGNFQSKNNTELIARVAANFISTARMDKLYEYHQSFSNAVKSLTETKDNLKKSYANDKGAFSKDMIKETNAALTDQIKYAKARFDKMRDIISGVRDLTAKG